MKQLDASRSNALRLIRNESSHIHNTAELDSYKECGFEEYEFMASLGERTCEVCGGMDGKRIKLTDKQFGVNFPPLHPNCRCTTIAFDPDDDLDDFRDRLENGELNYDKWYAKYVEGREQQKENAISGLTKGEKGDIMSLGSGDVALEYQRYGRNKETLINNTYIESGEYRRKFDSATDIHEVNRSLYQCSKAALKHRSGSVFEDMYWIDGKNGKVILSVTDSSDERAIIYTENIKKTISGYNDIITVHSHLSSMPPSVSDLNSCFKNHYKMGFVACHDGRLFAYSSNEEVNERIYSAYIERFLKDGFDEFNAQLKALERLSLNFDVSVWEVL